MRRHKMNAKRTQLDGIWFDSMAEMRRYSELRILERVGEISRLELQPKFPLQCGDKPVLIRSGRYPNGRRSSYSADFRYVRAGQVIVEDVKGQDTPYSRLKRAMVEAQYGVKVVIVKGRRR